MTAADLTLAPRLRRLSLLTALLSLCLLCARPAAAQSDPVMSQYYEIPTYYNPAAAGRTDFVNIRAAGRLQWLGVERAPRSIILGADMPMQLLGRRWGLGVALQQDRAGLYSNMSAAFQAAFKMKLLKGTLSVALQAGFANEGFKGSEVILDMGDDYHSSTDDAIPTTDVSGNAFDLGAGVWFEHPLFWAGISATHLLNPTISFSGDGTSSGSASSSGSAASETPKKYEFELRRALYFMAGSNIPIKNTLFEVVPSVFVACDPAGTTTFQANARLCWKKFLAAGVGYRYNDAVTASLSASFKGFFIGYSYDYPLNAMSKVSSGSHEIVAGYSLKLNLDKKSYHRHKSVRIM